LIKYSEQCDQQGIIQQFFW